MTLGIDIWYEREPFAAGSLPRELEFRSKHATEQRLTLGDRFGEGPYPIGYHNHVSPEIIAEFEEHLADDLVVVHPSDIGLEMPKHEDVYASRDFNTICHSFEDWKALVRERGGLTGAGIAWTRWPRTAGEERFYMTARKRPRRLNRFGRAHRLRGLLP